MPFISGMWFYTFSTTVFKTVVKNVLDRQTLIFTVAIFFNTKNNTLFQKTAARTPASEGSASAPVAANSGKKTCDFLM